MRRESYACVILQRIQEEMLTGGGDDAKMAEVKARLQEFGAQVRFPLMPVTPLRILHV